MGRTVLEIQSEDARAFETGNEAVCASTRGRWASSELSFELGSVERLDSMIDVRFFEILSGDSGDDPSNTGWFTG